MGKVILGAMVSLDGFIADEDDAVDPLLDWDRNGDVNLVPVLLGRGKMFF